MLNSLLEPATAVENTGFDQVQTDSLADTIFSLPAGIRWHQSISRNLWHHPGKPFVAVYPNAPLIWLDSQLMSQKMSVSTMDEDTMPHERRHGLEAIATGKSLGLLCTANMLMHPDTIKVLESLKLSSLIINHAEFFTPAALGPFDRSRYAKLKDWLGEEPQSRWLETTPFYLTGYPLNSVAIKSLEQIRLNLQVDKSTTEYEKITPKTQHALTAHQKLVYLKQLFTSYPQSLHIIVCRDGIEQKSLRLILPEAFVLTEAMLTNRNQPAHFKANETLTHSSIIITASLLPLLIQRPPETGYTVTFWQPLWSQVQTKSILSWFELNAIDKPPHVLQLLFCKDDINTMRYNWQRKPLAKAPNEGSDCIKMLHTWLKKQAIESHCNMTWMERLKIHFF